MYTQEGVSSIANFIPAYEESQYNRDSHFLIRYAFQKARFLTFIGRYTAIHSRLNKNESANFAYLMCSYKHL